MIHNETVNVWSHAFGLFYFVVALAFVAFWIWTRKPEGSEVPVWPLLIHATAAMLQMGLSAYFHLFNCQCATKFFYLQKLDFAGIAIMIAGSCTPPYYYGFLCE